MATRTSSGGGRARGGTTRSSAAARTASGRSTGAKGSGRASSSTGSKKPGRPTARASAPPRKNKKASPRRRRPARGSAWPLRLIRGTWVGTAHLLGAGVRRVGDGARDLDPAHRRDGLGLALLAGSLVVAAREWWGMPGPFADGVHTVVAGTVGSVGLILPLVLLSLSMRLMRDPQSARDSERVGTGLVLVGTAACALVHLSGGIPAPADGMAGVQDAGGLIGYLVCAPLAAALTPWLTVPILGLLAFFGVLVTTATPVHEIGPRLRELHRDLTGAREPGEDEQGGNRSTGSARAGSSRRRSRGPATGHDPATGDGPVTGDEAYEKAVETCPDSRRGPVGRRRRAGAPRAG
ncbi:MAG: segregation ATPase FtsK/SpoIIIE, family, partial [Actinomycetota bacterium]|nr:segregation ATPase FtsK/SpoIIIE, family [Actinomycetota bacterium]